MPKLIRAAVAAALLGAVPVSAQTAAPPVAGEPAKPQLVVAGPASEPTPGMLVVPKGTMVRLMVLVEVNTRQKKPGDRFVLRVDEPVMAGGIPVVPAGAKAWGEVTRVKENGVAGSTGRIAARLLHIDAGDAKIPLEGEDESKASGSGNRVAMAVLSFGVLGLLTKGNEGKLKGGHIFNGYFAEDMTFDMANGSFIPLPVPAAEPATALQPALAAQPVQ